MPVRVTQREVGPMENFQYLLTDEGTKDFWMVDPAWEAEALYDEAVKAGGKLRGLLITHAHFDHTNAIDKILKRGDVPVYLQRREAEFMDKGAPKELFPDIPRTSLKRVGPGDKLSLGSADLTFVHTPGHTPGSQCFLLEGQLVSGDTLFLSTCGRVDLPGSSPKEMFESLNGPIALLPSETMVLPGHNYSSRGTTASMEDVKKGNRFLQARTLERFLEVVGA